MAEQLGLIDLHYLKKNPLSKLSETALKRYEEQGFITINDSQYELTPETVLQIEEWEDVVWV